MLLIYNVILDESKKDKYDKIFSEIFRNLDCEFEIRYLNDDLQKPDLSRYSHLLVTGSELFASQNTLQNQTVSVVIRNFAEQEKAILGICYGHQMIAKSLVGTHACRKAKQPEFGWKKIKMKPNPLFSGIENRVFYESHYDEVCLLDDNFSIIATDNDNIIQAFQHNELPIWGIQFHPEVDYESGENSIRQCFREQPELEKFYINDINEAKNYNERFLIFKNFVRKNNGK